MDITMEILYERLCGRYPVRFRGQPERAAFCSVLFYHGSAARGNRLYLVTGEQYRALKAEAAGRMFLCLDDLEESELSVDDTLIYGPVGDQADVIFEEITDLLDCFHRWETDLNSCGYDLPGIRKMLSISCVYLKGELLLSDRSFNLIAYTREYNARNHKNFYVRAGTARLNETAVRTMLHDPDFHGIARKRDPFIYSYVGDEIRNTVLCFNLFREDEESYSGRLILHTSSETYTAEQFFMIRVLGERVNRVYNIISDFSLPLSPYTSLRIVLSGILAGEKTDSDRLGLILRDIGWEANDTYIMIYLSPELRSGEQPLHRLICDQLELLYHEACAVMQNGEGYLLVNMSRCGCRTAEDVQRRLPDVLRDNLLKAGLSNIFRDFTRAGIALLEAKAAVMAGNLRQSEYWYYHFKRYVVEYLLIGNPLQLPAASLIHPAFARLQAYDLQHGTELCRTLNVFIFCRYHMTRCAEMLFTHRSTLQRHIDKIMDLTDISFDSEETRFHLLYSYLVLKRQGSSVVNPDFDIL